MAFRRTGVILGLTAAAVVYLSGDGSAQVQTSDEQGCVNAINKSGGKVAATQGKENTSCVKDAGNDKLVGMTAEQCLTADRKNKVASASAKTVSSETAKCGPGFPPFGYAGAPVANLTAVQREIAFVHDVFGSPLSDGISTDTAEAKCQAGVSKSSEKYAATFVKAFGACKKAGLKDETIISPAGLGACVGDDPKNKISGTATKLTESITKSCTGLTLSDLFGGECEGQAGSAATLSACIADAADCRMCEMLKVMDALDVNCDTFDNGALDGSCSGCGNGVIDGGEECDDGGGNSDVSPDACRTSCLIAFCGDGIVDDPDECDDGNNTPGDLCDAACGCEPGNPASTCQEPLCPTSGELVLFASTTGVACVNNGDCAVGTCDGGLGRCVTDTELDTGWAGLAHNSDINDQVRARGDLICDSPFAGGPEPCGECRVVGIDPSTGQCRCSNDTRTQCDEPFSLDDDDCGGNICDCYFGPPIPLSSGNVPACVVNRFAEDIEGTANVDTGEGLISARLASVVYLGETILTPCPACVGDPIVGDGVRGGTCTLGVNDGQTCDADALNGTFPAPGGDGSSLDCFPEVGKNVSGAGLRIRLDSTTGTASLPPAAISCGFDVAPTLCPCGVCSGDQSLTCTSNTDCTGVGVCARVANGNPKSNGCADGVCSDVGGGEGACLANPPDNFCDGITRDDGRGFVQCNNNGDCSVFGPSMGACTLASDRPCFLDPITATGVQDPNTPVAVAAFCIPATGNSGINTVAGLPGPGRVTNAAQAETYCGSNPLVTYTPGVGGCP